MQLKLGLVYNKIIMEYNNNTYITITHEKCEELGIKGNHRTNQNHTICILEFHENETIPPNILNAVINIMTHQQALELVETNEWKSNIVI